MCCICIALVWHLKSDCIVLQFQSCIQTCLLTANRFFPSQTCLAVLDWAFSVLFSTFLCDKRRCKFNMTLVTYQNVLVWKCVPKIKASKDVHREHYYTRVLYVTSVRLLTMLHRNTSLYSPGGIHTKFKRENFTRQINRGLIKSIGN